MTLSIWDRNAVSFSDVSTISMMMGMSSLKRMILQDGGTRQAHLFGLQHNPLVKRAAFMAVAFTDEDPQELTFFGYFHGLPPKHIG